jgi:hypothetical protein
MSEAVRTEMRRLVDLVDRGPRDDLFFPAVATQTIFRRTWPPMHHAVPDVVEVAYKGKAHWGGRITIPLSRYGYGDMLQWICLRLQPRSWLGADVDAKILSGEWTYADASGAWMWASSLGSIAIEKVELEIGDTLIETWGGEWMDVWSRIWMEGGRAAGWDYDVVGQRRIDTLRNSPDWMTIKPTEDGYVYCWLPLPFLRRPTVGFPLAALGETEMRIHITLAPFTSVIRRRAVPRTDSTESPVGKIITFLDVTGVTPIPYDVRLPSIVPLFDDVTVLAGVALLDEPQRLSLMHEPREILYDRVQEMRFDIGEKAVINNNTVSMQLPLRDLNGPIREICWFVRRKGVWDYNEWTNYGRLLEDALVAAAPYSGVQQIGVPYPQQPLVTQATLRVDNAIWRSEAEQYWRYEYGLAHRGGIRAAGGMLYGFVLGDAAGWSAGDQQPAGTVNASRALLRLDLDIAVPADSASSSCSSDSNWGWEVHVFGIGINWMRFVKGSVGPLFRD